MTAGLITDGQFQIGPGVLTGHVLMPDIANIEVKAKRGGKDPIDGPYLVLTCPIPLDLCPQTDSIGWLAGMGTTVKRLIVLIEFEPGVLKVPDGGAS